MSESTRDALADLLGGASDSSVQSRLRNLVVHLCFGSDEIATHPADPWAVESGAPLLAGYGTIDYLRSLNLLTACDLPLALIYWTGNGLEFVDCWAVRRRPIALPLSTDWPSLSGQRLRAENEARLFQFQDHLASLLRSEAAPSALEASDYFRFLPPAGLLPLLTTTRVGFTTATFFAGLKIRSRTIYIDGARLRELLEVSPTHPPIDTETQEVMFVFRTRQNHPPPSVDASEQAYSVFASGHLSYVGTARFDLARWDRSNYGLL